MTAPLQSDYIVKKFGALIVIIDINKGNKLVTNDIENVINEVGQQNQLNDYVVVYRDSDNCYEKIIVNSDNTFKQFEPMTSAHSVKDFFDVMEILLKSDELERV